MQTAGTPARAGSAHGPLRQLLRLRCARSSRSQRPMQRTREVLPADADPIPGRGPEAKEKARSGESRQLWGRSVPGWERRRLRPRDGFGRALALALPRGEAGVYSCPGGRSSGRVFKGSRAVTGLPARGWSGNLEALGKAPWHSAWPPGRLWLPWECAPSGWAAESGRSARCDAPQSLRLCLGSGDPRRPVWYPSLAALVALKMLTAPPLPPGRKREPRERLEVSGEPGSWRAQDFAAGERGVGAPGGRV